MKMVHIGRMSLLNGDLPSGVRVTATNDGHSQRRAAPSTNESSCLGVLYSFTHALRCQSCKRLASLLRVRIVAARRTLSESWEGWKERSPATHRTGGHCSSSLSNG